MTVRQRCQACHAQGRSVQDYPIGEEQVISLCASCAEQVFARLPEVQEREQSPEEQEQSPDFSFTKKVAIFAPTALLTMGLPALLHAPLPAEVFGLVGAIMLAAKSPKIYAEMKESLPEPLVTWLDGAAERRRHRAQTGEYSTWDRLLARHWQEEAAPQEEGPTGRLAAPEQPAREQKVFDQQEQPDQSSELDTLFQTRATKEDNNGITRLTIAQMVEHSQHNDYRIWIGRSLTDPTHKAVQINFYKQHFRFMGASQRGKSSMVAAFLEIVTRTHSPSYVQLALLDMEDQTSKLFAHLPHIATIKRDGQRIRLYARTPDEVLERLINVVEIMRYRYGLPIEQLRALPILLVYLEEFLALKNEFKSRVDRCKKKSQVEQQQAQSDYATLVYCIESLCQQGLKARVQLLLCAQVEYADDDFKEALVNVQCGFAFCVRPTAAASAGFQNGALIRRNARDNKVGQAVVETPDCNDLVLAPEYDREQRLAEWERMHSMDQAPEDIQMELPASVPPISETVPSVQPIAQADNITVLPKRSEYKAQPTLQDAILCWNELVGAGQNPSRNNLQQALLAKEFECRENWARKFYEDIKALLAKEQSDRSVGE